MGLLSSIFGRSHKRSESKEEGTYYGVPVSEFKSEHDFSKLLKLQILKSVQSSSLFDEFRSRYPELSHEIENENLKIPLSQVNPLFNKYCKLASKSAFTRAEKLVREFDEESGRCVFSQIPCLFLDGSNRDTLIQEIEKRLKFYRSNINLLKKSLENIDFNDHNLGWILQFNQLKNSLSSEEYAVIEVLISDIEGNKRFRDFMKYDNLYRDAKMIVGEIR